MNGVKPCSRYHKGKSVHALPRREKEGKSPNIQARGSGLPEERRKAVFYKKGRKVVKERPEGKADNQGLK